MTLWRIMCWLSHHDYRLHHTDWWKDPGRVTIYEVCRRCGAPHTRGFQIDMVTDTIKVELVTNFEGALTSRLTQNAYLRTQQVNGGPYTATKHPQPPQ